MATIRRFESAVSDEEVAEKQVAGLGGSMSEPILPGDSCPIVLR
jgi:hypothetical protein